ncbi:MAG: DUF3784 domain-containing protein [Tissierellia bacterium]|nr:DUF3784 domain-containing protein [Tissierellia bacterium]
MVITIFVIALFILVGIVFSMGKGSFLIAGFNTMSKEEKEKYDIASLCKFMGKIMFIIAFSVALFPLSEIFEMKALYYIGMTLNPIVVIFTLVYLNTGNRFQK